MGKQKQSQEQLQRIGVSLEASLLEKFDALIEGQGYANRSEAIRDLIRDRLAAKQLAEPETYALAAVCVVYDHHQPGLNQKLNQLQHSHVLHTIASVHVHMDEHNCLEVILLRGKVKDIRALSDRIVSTRGVTLGKVNLLAAGDETPTHHHNHHHAH